MSEENVELVRRGLKIVSRALRDHEFPAEEVGQIIDPEIRLDVSRRVFNPHVYEGIEGFRQMIESIWEVWEEFELLPEEYFDADDMVAVVLEERGRTRNGLETSREIAYLYRVRAGKLVEWIGGMEPDEALKAVKAPG